MIDEKVRCMRIAKKYDGNYWDGDRRYGYGGYHYDGRWRAVAKRLIESYRLKEDSKILDVGCGKAYLLYEFSKLLPGAELVGIDMSSYALADAKPEIKDKLLLLKAQESYPFKSCEFDLVLSINTLHNLEIFELKKALQEISRVGRKQYICVESYRDEQELFNLQCWALTCASFYSAESWEWVLNEFGYIGDFELIFFE
jgi:ubiquinone/menaquinone biosynthesis C-methylase UbiE